MTDVDIRRAARDISASAVRTLKHGPSRRCRLRHREVVLRVLLALRAGFSQAASARAAGITEQGLRLWLQLGASGAADPYVRFLRAVEAIRAPEPALVPAPAPAAAPALKADSCPPAPAPAAVSVAPVAPVVSQLRPTPPPAETTAPRLPPMTPERMSGLVKEFQQIRERLRSFQGRPEHRKVLLPSEVQEVRDLKARLDAIHLEINGRL